MKRALYGGLLVGLVPIQVTVLHYVSIGGIRPDLCWVAVCLVGLLDGEVEGLVLGLSLGFVQDLFSAGELWLNMVTKGSVGFLSGLASRYLSNAATGAVLGPVLGLTLVSGAVFIVFARPGGLMDTFIGVRSVLLPQAAFDTAVVAGLYWLIGRRQRAEALMPGGRLGLGG